MKLIESIVDFRKQRRSIKGTVGFVPTMGYLHEGHLSLVRLARQESADVIVSIFVNPTQFGPREDNAIYPRDIPRDLDMLEEAGTDLVFIPSEAEIYPEGFSTWVEVKGISECLEGAHRPGHFRGVATIVAKLFNLVQPDRAYFGQKDVQQVLVIKRMVTDLGMPLEIVVCPTIREQDGLAMSSRNSYLNPRERKAAVVLHDSLILGQKLWREGERSAKSIRSEMTTLIQGEPLAKIDYVSIADTETLAELDDIKGEALASLAVKIGKTRLIDNIVLIR